MTETTKQPAPKVARPEFRYLDGIRGTAALIVVFYHAFLFTGYRGDAREAMPIWGQIIGQGSLGVPIFIVLSGYVLMLPVANRSDLWFSNGVWTFIKRRSRRILPPYFAALTLSLILIWAVPIMQVRSGTQWDSKVPVTLGNVLSHYLLIHDFSPFWIGRINGPLWSVAVEWQIYFLMPLLLLLWKRIPPVLIVSALLVLTTLPFVIRGFAYVHPWFLALFAVGMLAAQLSVRPKEVRWTRTTMGIAFVVMAIVYILHRKHLIPIFSSMGLWESAVGIFLATVLVWAARSTAVTGKTPWALRVFESKPMMFAGLISYSIYLIHSPLIGLANLLLLPLGFSTITQYLILTFAVIPVVLVICWLFFLAVEKHFLNRRQSRAQAELSEHGHPHDATLPPSQTEAIAEPDK